MDEEEVIRIYSDTETTESGSEEEQQTLRRSSSLDNIGSDDTTLGCSSKSSRKLSLLKRNMRDNSMLLTEEGHDGCKDSIGSSPCVELTRGAKVEDEIGCVIIVD
jgi:hypothetical protein